MNSKTHRTIQYLCLFMSWDMELRSFSVLRWFDNLDIAQDSGGTAIALDLGFGIDHRSSVEEGSRGGKHLEL